MPPAFRAIQSGLVILTLVLFGSVARAQSKDKMAVLGLEAVVGENGKIDPGDTKFAKELTKELKSRAQLSSKYAPLKEHRELVDEKLMNNCGAETPSCMALIGQSMGADVVLFGSVKNAKKGGWIVNLKLVSVAKKNFVSSDANVYISADQASGAQLSAWVKERMRKLTGETSTGTVIIAVTGAETGKVLVDDSPRDNLKSGQATLQVEEGRRKITIDADGFRLWEDTVTVSADKPTNLTPDLVRSDKKLDTTITDPGEGDRIIKREGTEGTKKNNKTMFKVAAAVGLGGAAITGALWAVSYYTGPIADYRDADISGKSFNGRPLGKGDSIGYGDCGGGKFTDTMGGTSDTSLDSKFDKACDRIKVINYGLVPATAVLGLVGAGALIYVIVSKDDSSKERVVGRQKKRKNLLVTPVVTPDGTGATLRFDW